MPDPVPHQIRLLADERARARRARDWATADRIKDELVAAGWKVVDAGTLYSLEPLPPAVVEVNGQLRYGTSEAVPSRLAEPADAPATVVLVADDREAVLARATAAVSATAPGVQLVVVANAPSSAVAEELPGLAHDVEVVQLARRLGAAAAVNAGIRRASGRVVLVLDPAVEVAGETVARLVGALDDPSVGVAGLRGLASDDLVHFDTAPEGSRRVVAVDGLAMAFHRDDYLARGPLDEYFKVGAYLHAWWSLVLRDVPEDAGADAESRAALVVEGRYSLLGSETAEDDERQARRQRYRLLRYFAARRDLLVAADSEPRPARGFSPERP
jgi:Glycosyl transferase family 2